jgi:hypothetical protein
VVKRQLRNLEKYGLRDLITGETYCRGAFDVYNALAKNSETWRAKIGSKVMIDAFFYQYIPGRGEDTSGATQPQQVLTPISRPKTNPRVDPVPQIRSHFCFDFIADGASGRSVDKVRYRPLSCHCDSCIAREWNKCVHKTQNGWKVASMTSEAASATKKGLKSRKSRLSDLRRLAARATAVGEIVALEAPANNEGFSFWLARVEARAAADHYGRAQKVRGVNLVQGHWYISVKVIDRFPADSPSQFRLKPDEETWKINAEAVVLRNVQLGQVEGVAKKVTRSILKKRAQHVRQFELQEAELLRCTEAAEEKLDANGKQEHFAAAQSEPVIARNRIG